MDLATVVIVAFGVLVFGLASRRLEGTPLTLPLVFALFGWLIGSGGLAVADIDATHGGIHLLAEVTLIVVLFADAARIDARRLLVDHDLPLRMLVVGMPLTILGGALVARFLFPEATWPMAFLVAAILAPTDAALGQTVVASPRVPLRIRQAINVESGLNDGIALPLVLVFAMWAGAAGEHGSGAGEVFKFALLQLTLGPLVGAAVGYAGGRLIDSASRAGWASEPFQGICALAVALCAFAAAELAGGNGFIAAFAAGLAFGASVRSRCEFLFEFMESQGQLLTLLAFLVFGAAMLPGGLSVAVAATSVLAVLFLTVVRMLPIAISLGGTGLSWPSKLFLGWFGPRGLASILFALLILEEHPVAGGEELLACIVLTVALSILLHGISAAPLAAAYGRYVGRVGECVEHRHVEAMPLRHGASEIAANTIRGKQRPAMTRVSIYRLDDLADPRARLRTGRGSRPGRRALR